MRQGSVQLRETAANDLRGPLLVGRAQVREQKADGQRLGALVDEVLKAFDQGGLIQWPLDGAAGAHPLGDAHPQVAGRQGFHHLHPQVVPVFLQALAHFQQVTESVGGDETHGGALALHQSVGGHSGPVNHEVGISQELVQGQPVGRGGLLQPVHHAYGRVIGRGLRLEEPRLSTLVI